MSVPAEWMPNNHCHLTCPICFDPLTQVDRSLRCPAGHSFDLAREGYVNLIPVQHRPRGHHGDLPEMLHARRRFLDAGYYEPLLDQLTHSAAGLLQSPPPQSPPPQSPNPQNSPPLNSADGQPGVVSEPCIADIGCGEGYYIGGIGKGLREVLRGEREITPALFGMDLSRDAVRLAARRYPEVTFFVGDINRRIHLPDHSVDCLLNIFAPRNAAEFARVLAPRGAALIVIPGPDHLASLRAEFDLLEIQEEKEEALIDRFSGEFQLIDRTEVEYSLEIRPDAVTDLLTMGPSYWHREQETPFPSVGSPRSTEVSFIILHLQRTLKAP